ncbi:hypothetical protein D3C80_1602610 [compost metagenome]
MLVGVGQRATNTIRPGLQFGHLRELGLPPGTPVIDDHFARHGPGKSRPAIDLDQRQGQVDARGHAGGRPDRSALDEDALRIDDDLRVSKLEVVRQSPVGRRFPTVQQTGFRQQEGAGADAGDPYC